MRRSRQLWRRLLVGGAVIFAILLGVAGLKVVTGIGPSVPGPNVRNLLGFGYTLSSCAEGRDVRLPSGTAAQKSWDKAGTMPDPYDEPRAVALGDKILVISGLSIAEDGSKFVTLARARAYDPATQTWTTLPELPVPLDHPGVVVHGGLVYVVGGYEDGFPSDAFFRYLPAERRWEELPPLPTARGALGAAVVGDLIYAVGGAGPYGEREKRFGFDFSYKTVEIFDVSTRTWSSGPPLAVARNHVGVAAFDGQVYAVGGRDNGDSSIDAVERLDPARGSWEQTTPLPFGVSSLGLVVVGDRLVAVGGGDEYERWVTPATWSFDPAAERWQRLPDLRRARHGHATAVFGETLFVFGGAPCAGYGVTNVIELLELAGVRD